MSFKPYIAIGHGISTDGTWDSGCTWNGFTEAALAKEVVAGILEVFDVNRKQYITDYPDNGKNMIRCVEEANANGCTHYISIHLDWDQAPSGIMPCIYPGSSGGLAMAEAIRASMKLRIPNLNDRGNSNRPDLYEVRATNMPAVVMEIGSIKADNALIRNNTRLFGQAIAYGLMDVAGESYSLTWETQSAPVEAPPASAPVNTSVEMNAVSNSGYNWSVENIQYLLNICNYGAPSIDNVWGPETAQCLKNAQHNYRIEEDGIWGPVTQAHAEQQITMYQTRLESLGYPCGGVDGIAGINTYKAVKVYQANNGLAADGIVGELTYAKLFGPVEAGTLELPNFTADEFKCNCGCGGDILDELKIKIQQLRDLLVQRSGGGDRPLVITAGYRCPTQNRRVGGVSDSLHMKGRACDLYTPGMSRAMVDEIAYCAQQVGLGTLKYYQSLFVHVQLDPADRVMEP